MDKALGGVIGALLGVYAIRVAIAGNGQALLTELRKETGYLELLVAVWVLWQLHKNPGTHQLTDQLIGAAAIAALIKAVTANTNIVQALEDFGTGKRSMLDTAKLIFGL